MKLDLYQIKENIYSKFSKIDGFLNKKTRPYLFILKYQDELYAVPLRTNKVNRKEDLLLEINESEKISSGYLDFSNAFKVLSEDIFFKTSRSIEINIYNLDKKINSLFKEVNKKNSKNIIQQNRILNIQRELYLKPYLEANGLPTNKQKFICRSKEHNDSTPSMQYNAKNNTVHCFSCGVTYNLISLVQQDYDVGYNKALKIIDSMILDDFKDINIDLDVISKPSKNKKMDSKYFNDIVSYYSQFINQTDYLFNRGISKEIQEKFKIGYNPKTNQLILPVFNNGGYYFMRNIDNDKAKYIYQSNMKVPPLILNNLNKESNECFLVEGYIDALSLAEMNENVISFNGANNFENVKAVIDIYSEFHYILAFDNDEAGNRCKDSVIDYMNENNVSFSILNLEDGRDVNDELVSNRDNFKKIIENAKRHHRGAFLDSAINKFIKNTHTDKEIEIMQSILEERVVRELIESGFEVYVPVKKPVSGYSYMNIKDKEDSWCYVQYSRFSYGFDLSTKNKGDKENGTGMRVFSEEELNLENVLKTLEFSKERVYSGVVKPFIAEEDKFFQEDNIKITDKDLPKEKEIDEMKNNNQEPIVEKTEEKSIESDRTKDVSDKLVINLRELIKQIQENNNLTNEEILKKLDETKKEIQNEIGAKAKVYKVEGVVLEVEPVELEKNIAYNFKVAKTNTKGGYTKGVIFGGKSGSGAPTFKEGDFVKLEGNFKHQKYNEKDYFTFVNVKTIDVQTKEKNISENINKTEQKRSER